MPSLYFLALCRGSVLDQESNNFTLFELTEELQYAFPEAEGPIVAPYEMHAYWNVEAECVGGAFELRAFMARPDGTRAVESIVAPWSPTALRLRLRMQGIMLPREYGSLQLCMEWRRVGVEAWTPGAITWPIATSAPRVPVATPAE